MVLVQFLNDTVVIPRESEWFGFYTPGQDKELQTLQESTLYTEVRMYFRRPSGVRGSCPPTQVYFRRPSGARQLPPTQRYTSGGPLEPGAAVLFLA